MDPADIAGTPWLQLLELLRKDPDTLLRKDNEDLIVAVLVSEDVIPGDLCMPLYRATDELLSRAVRASGIMWLLEGQAPPGVLHAMVLAFVELKLVRALRAVRDPAVAARMDSDMVLMFLHATYPRRVCWNYLYGVLEGQGRQDLVPHVAPLLHLHELVV